MDFKNIPNKYRPIPFWSWNDKLETEETRRQIHIMKNAGIGGFFMHARNGLLSEYMGEEWFENVGCAIEEAEKLDMYPWAYDENGFPSGFASGKVNSMGKEYQQKLLRIEEGEHHTDTTLCNSHGMHVYYEVKSNYVDLMNPRVTDAFIKEAYEPYYEKFKDRIEGFFTDEPQMAFIGEIPWSFTIPKKYENRYGEKIEPKLVELFMNVGDYKNTRVKYYKLITDMFSENYCKRVYDWCNERNLKLTGHLLLEEDFYYQTVPNGAIMPHYEYFHIPGMDWLGRNVFNCPAPLQVSSVAHQMGKKQIISENFACSGHNISFEEMRRIMEWQMVRGVTLLCPHLEGYSLKGMRKRDYPPAMYYQQPWWNYYKEFTDSMSRIGMILTEGAVKYDVLVLHTITSGWTAYEPERNKDIDYYFGEFMNVINTLEQKHILFHLGDETIMERHAYVKNGKMVIGTQEYSTLVIPKHEMILDATAELIEEFKNSGGKIVYDLNEFEDNSIVDSPDITYTKRSFDGYDVLYFVNSTEKAVKAKIKYGSKVIDIKTGEVSDFDGYYEFAPFDSLLVIDDGIGQIEHKDKGRKNIDISGKWKVRNFSKNTLTLDFCDYYFDGELIEKHGYVLNITERAANLKRPVDLRCVFEFTAEYISDDMQLVIEEPELFEININGRSVKRNVQGYFCDREFKTINISEYAEPGKNTVELSTVLKQSKKVYKNREISFNSPNDLNIFRYDMEIESIYIIGSFSVRTDGEFEELENNSVGFNGEFVICEPPEEIILADIQKQGFPFFAGELAVEKEIHINDAGEYMIEFKKMGINAVEVSVNDEKKETIIWNPTVCNVGKLESGNNTVKLKLVNNLRNMLGPHHVKSGERLSIGADAFFMEKGVWCQSLDYERSENYCFVKSGLYN